MRTKLMLLPVSDCSREEENSLESVFVPLVDIIYFILYV